MISTTISLRAWRGLVRVVSPVAPKSRVVFPTDYEVSGAGFAKVLMAAVLTHAQELASSCFGLKPCGSQKQLVGDGPPGLSILRVGLAGGCRSPLASPGDVVVENLDLDRWRGERGEESCDWAAS